jgi:hypothetical protein
LLSSFFFFWCTSFHNSIDKRIEVPDAAHVVSDKLQLSHTYTHTFMPPVMILVNFTTRAMAKTNNIMLEEILLIQIARISTR